MNHDHVGVMLDAVLAIPVPDGYTATYRERHDTVIDRTFRDVVIAPDGLDVSVFTFGTPGAYACVYVDDSGDTYTVGVFSRDVAYTVQAAASFTTARDAVASALGQIRSELWHQQHRC